MKKLIAIAFLALHMFTICGHMVLYQYFVYKSDRLFAYQISRGMYNLNDLVEVKVPVNMPSVQSWPAYEHIHGQIQFNQAAYNYVKLKLSKDTIYLMCIPNYETTRLNNQNIIDAKAIADIPVNKKDHVPFGKIINLDHYNFPVTLYKLVPAINVLSTKNNICCSHPVSCYLPLPEQPPKTLA